MFCSIIALFCCYYVLSYYVLLYSSLLLLLYWPLFNFTLYHAMYCEDHLPWQPWIPRWCCVDGWAGRLTPGSREESWTEMETVSSEPLVLRQRRRRPSDADSAAKASCTPRYTRRATVEPAWRRWRALRNWKMILLRKRALLNIFLSKEIRQDSEAVFRNTCSLKMCNPACQGHDTSVCQLVLLRAYCSLQLTESNDFRL